MYQDPILKKYIELIKTSMPVIKSFYQGDPFNIPKVNLPAMILSKSQTGIAPLTNAEDAHQIGLVLTIVTDIRDQRNDNDLIAPGIAQLYDIIEGRDEGTYKLKTNCILNILRTNQIVDSANNLRTDLATITNSQYGMTLGKRSPEGYSVEGQVEFIATYSQLRN